MAAIPRTAHPGRRPPGRAPGERSPQPRPVPHVAVADRAFRVAVTDTGPAIARRIVELHGGQLRAASTPGRGSTFAFTVPGRLERRTRAVAVAVERRRPQA